MSDQSRSARFEMRIEPGKLEVWREFAKAESRVLTRFVELAVDGYIDLVKATRRADEQAARRAEALLRRDPVEVRRLLAYGREPEAE